jgi:hypothetical protein
MVDAFPCRENRKFKKRKKKSGEVVRLLKITTFAGEYGDDIGYLPEHQNIH